ncbi:hypothetical protein QQS21_004281 [Conoideocrella luteorostrata]|uniref:Uncharacterized protein n=1 Tax=Conoideocrella luteorostrata TaxID=1105319 RepID=A0AAJ0CUI7_9HYPO|nr:hypothetical protein QQS21_004281 [Conoideocrella luteorostrata]
MQTVPSLVGTGTAIAAAASGLVFGQPTGLNHDYEISTAVRQGARGHKKSISIDTALPSHSQSPSSTHTPPSRRPATSSAGAHASGSDLHAISGSVYQTTRPPLSRRQRPQNPQTSPSNTSSRRQSFVAGQGNLVSGVSVVEGSKESGTSTNSWLKRLSIRPQSQHGSPRSSILADASSVTFSYGSAAPILSRSGSVSKPLPPNKLVKRSCSRNNHSEDLPLRKSKGHLPSIRRPATSHQRSATLQRFRAEIDVAGSSPHPKYSFDEPIRPEELLGASPIEDLDQSSRTHRVTRCFGWASFFHSKAGSVVTSSNSYGRLGGGSASASQLRYLDTKRIYTGKSLSIESGAHLIKPRMVSNSSTINSSFALSSYIEEKESDQAAQLRKDPVDSKIRVEMASEVAPSSQPRRSFSSSFSHTAHWASRTSGSLRRTKRGASQPNGENKRHVSAPVRSLQPAVGRSDTTTKPPIARIHQGSVLDSAATLPRPAPKRNASSPLPPPSNLSGVHADLLRQSPAGRGASHSIRPNQPSGSSTSSASAAMSQRRGSHYERSSALDSSDGDARELMSGDEDDTDFKSDTLFDSVRTVGSGRLRAVETPLESVYDESPPSTGGNKRSKRLSIQEMLDRTWNGDSKIMEEDETNLTPVRVTRRSSHASQVNCERREDPRFGLEPSSRHDVDLATHDMGRFSLDDDFDEDWTRDADDAPFNALSPPSKSNSPNPSVINPNVRLALAGFDGNSLPSPNPALSHTERSLGNIFDWSEPPTHDRKDPSSGVIRPKTAYAKQQLDSRGGRSVVRKGPMPTHVRSQSVPVVNDSVDDLKPTGSKYGTWGMGTKTVSEDWDEDFEFAGGDSGPDGKDSRDLFAVPESIRAAQPSVKAHSGQIRELSLLVNDLKRLCRHGRELNMLNGDQKPVWKEAEGIIALASPDEDNVNGDDQSGSSVYMDAFEATSSTRDEKHYDYDQAFERLEAVIERNEPPMSKTAVVRERQSPRRRSVFSPDDDIFGANWPLADDRPRSSHPSRPRTPENQPNKSQDLHGVVQSVMETMQHRSAAPAVDTSSQDSRKRYSSANRMHFDTTSLKILVRRAGELRDILSDMIRRADQLTQSPIRSPRHERRLDSSPAFTRVFDDPGSSPPQRPTKIRGNSSTIVECPSPENSPPSNMGRRVPLMTVN